MFNEPLISPILRIVIFALPFLVFSAVSRKIITALKKGPISEFFGEVVNHGLKFVLAIIFVFMLSYGIFGASLSYLFGVVISSIILFIISIKIFPFFSKRERAFKELFLYSFPLAFFGLFYIIIGKIDVLMIGAFVSSEATGIYNAALPTASLLNMIPISLMVMFFPIITERFAQNNSIDKIYTTINKWIFLTVFPMFLMFALFSSQILNIMFGESYLLGAMSLSILSFGFLVYNMNLPNLNMLKMINKTKIILLMTFFAVILNVILNWFLIQRYGMIGGAIATAISYLLISFVSVFFIKKFFPKIKLFNFKYVSVFVSAIIPFSIIYFIKEKINANNLFIVIGLGILFCVIYVGLLIATRSFEEEDKTILNKILKRVIK